MTVSNVPADGRLASLKARHEKCKEEYRQLRQSLSATDAQLSGAKRRKLRAKDDLTAYENTLKGIPLAPPRHMPQPKVVKTKKGANAPLPAAMQALAAAG